jgi:hypothetical protein
MSVAGHDVPRGASTLVSDRHDASDWETPEEVLYV